jgi:polysaccharide pyruvyl transferase WcaK-like protein
MKETPGHRKIGILAQMGWGNLGDAAIQEAMIYNIRKHLPDAEVIGFSSNPADTTLRHNIPCFPISGFSLPYYSVASLRKDSDTSEGGRKTNDEQVKDNLRELIKDKVKALPLIGSFIRKAYHKTLTVIKEIGHIGAAYHIVKELNSLIISGSGQLDELWGGAWGHPYALFKWALISKVARTRFMMVSVGVEILDSRLTRFFVKWALRLSDYRSYRDRISKERLAGWKFTREDPVFPDLAFSLPLDGHPVSDNYDKGRTVVGISPMFYYRPGVWPKHNPEIYKNYINKLASFTSWLIQEHYRISLFVSDIPDLPVVKDLKDTLRDDHKLDLDGLILEPSIATLDELLAHISKVDYVVASRLHGVKLSHLLNKPVLALSYEKKVAAHMADMEQSEYCDNIEKFEIDTLKRKFKLLEANREKIKSVVYQKAKARRRSLEIQYEKIWSE